MFLIKLDFKTKTLTLNNINIEFNVTEQNIFIQDIDFNAKKNKKTTLLIFWN